MTGSPSIAWRQPKPRDGEPPILGQGLDILFARLGTDRTAFAAMPLIEIIRRHAARIPDEIAVIGRYEQLNWATLMARVQGLAGTIAGRVPPGSAVAVLLPDGPSALVATLACVAAGRIALIMNALHPVARNNLILRHAGAALVILDDCPPGLTLPPGTAAISTTAVEIGSALLIPAPPDAPAFVIYTSGSTGRPKGIVVSQASAFGRHLATFLTGGSDAPARAMPLFAIATISGLGRTLGTLASGGSVIVPGDAPPITMMLAERPTALIALPALVRTLLASPDAYRAFQSVRGLYMGGEAALGSDIDLFYRHLHPDCRIQISYGQTEVGVSRWFVPRSFRTSGPMPLGFIHPDVEYAVLNETGAPVPDGDMGTLHVRSSRVALGEWEKGRCVAGRMMTDPVDPKLRRLNTGDVVTVRPDGMLGFGGRADRQVKVRGFRIEPMEIEETFRRQAGITDVAVAARSLDGKTELLVFVVASDPCAASRAFAIATTSLPSQMRPRRMVLLPTLPRLPSGKIDQSTMLDLADRGGMPVPLKGSIDARNSPAADADLMQAAQ